MVIGPDPGFETYVTIDTAPLKVEVLKPDNLVQIMIGTPSGGYLILCMSNPAFMAGMARQIADAAVGLAFAQGARQADARSCRHAVSTNAMLQASFSCLAR